MSDPTPHALAHDDRAELRYRLHLLALRGGSFELQPGYRRTEERLRPKLPRVDVPWQTVDAALAAESSPDTDRAWFTLRDDAEAPERQRLALARAASSGEPGAADGSGWTTLPEAAPTPIRLVQSSALRPAPALAPSAGMVAVGHDTPACLAWLAAVSLDAYGSIVARAPSVPPDAARFGALMIGGQDHALTLPDAALEALLTAIVTTIVPPQHRGAETEAILRALREGGLLPEHPGEFDRMIHGISRRRADRIHRAWLRGSFALPPSESSNP